MLNDPRFSMGDPFLAHSGASTASLNVSLCSLSYVVRLVVIVA